MAGPQGDLACPGWDRETRWPSLSSEWGPQVSWTQGVMGCLQDDVAFTSQSGEARPAPPTLDPRSDWPQMGPVVPGLLSAVSLEVAGQESEKTASEERARSCPARAPGDCHW